MISKYPEQIPTNVDKADMADKHPAEPAARTLRLLRSWEQKYGLEVIHQHLDAGLFSRDRDEQRLCYEWLKRRKLAKRRNAVVKVVLGLTLVMGAGFGVLSALSKEQSADFGGASSCNSVPVWSLYSSVISAR